MADSVIRSPIPIAINPAGQPLPGQEQPAPSREARREAEASVRTEPDTARREARLNQAVTAESSARTAAATGTAQQQQGVVSRPLNQPLFITQEADGQEVVPSDPEALAGVSVHAQSLRPSETTVGEEIDRNADAFAEARARADSQDAALTATELNRIVLEPPVPNIAPPETASAVPPELRTENAADLAITRQYNQLPITDRAERRAVNETLEEESFDSERYIQELLAELNDLEKAAGTAATSTGYASLESSDFAPTGLDNPATVLSASAAAQGVSIAELAGADGQNVFASPVPGLTAFGETPGTPGAGFSPVLSQDGGDGQTNALFTPLLSSQPGDSNPIAAQGQPLPGILPVTGPETNNPVLSQIQPQSQPGFSPLSPTGQTPRELALADTDTDPVESFDPSDFEGGQAIINSLPGAPGIPRDLLSEDYDPAADPEEAEAIALIRPETLPEPEDTPPDLPVQEGLSAATESTSASYAPADTQEESLPQPELYREPPMAEQGESYSTRGIRELTEFDYSTTDVPENPHTIGDPSFQGGPEIAQQRANSPVESFSDSDEEGRLASPIAGAVLTNTGIAGNSPFDVTASDPEEAIDLQNIIEDTEARRIAGKDPGPLPSLGDFPEYVPEADPEEAFITPVRQEANRAPIEENPVDTEEPRLDGPEAPGSQPGPTLYDPAPTVRGFEDAPANPFPGEGFEAGVAANTPRRIGLGREEDGQAPGDPTERTGASVTADNAIGIDQQPLLNQPQAIRPVETSGDATIRPDTGAPRYANEAEEAPAETAVAGQETDQPGRNLNPVETLALGPTAVGESRPQVTDSPFAPGGDQEETGKPPQTVAPRPVNEEPVVREDVGPTLTEEELLQRAIQEARDTGAGQAVAGNPLVPNIGYDSEITVLQEARAVADQPAASQSYPEPLSAGSAGSLASQGGNEALKATTFLGSIQG